MKLKKKLGKPTLKLLCLTLFASLAITNICLADEDEDDGMPKKAYSLGQERPKPKPKPKVIIKEKIVEKMVCPSGSNWNADVSKCQDEDGNDVVVTRKKKIKQTIDDDNHLVANHTPQKQATAPHDDRYVYPNSRLRFKLLKCSMKGETVSCNAKLTNTLEGRALISFGNFTITDENGRTYKKKTHYSNGYTNSHDYGLNYGDNREFRFDFPLVDTAATTLVFAGTINANNGSDPVGFENITILK